MSIPQITVGNYNEIVPNLDFDLISSREKDLILDNHDYIKSVLELYNDDDEIKNSIDDHIELLNQKFGGAIATSTVVKSKKKASLSNDLLLSLSTEQRLLKRVEPLFNKEVDIDRFINTFKAFQKEIASGTFSNKSQNSELLKDVLSSLSKVNDGIAEGKYKRKRKLKITFKNKDKLTEIKKSLVVYPSVQAFKRLIALHGKEISAEKRDSVSKSLKNLFEKDKINQGDPFHDQVRDCLLHLNELKSGEKFFLPVYADSLSGEGTLSGLGEVMRYCGCHIEKK